MLLTSLQKLNEGRVAAQLPGELALVGGASGLKASSGPEIFCERDAIPAHFQKRKYNTKRCQSESSAIKLAAIVRCTMRCK